MDPAQRRKLIHRDIEPVGVVYLGNKTDISQCQGSAVAICSRVGGDKFLEFLKTQCNPVPRPLTLRRRIRAVFAEHGEILDGLNTADNQLTHLSDAHPVKT